MRGLGPDGSVPLAVVERSGFAESWHLGAAAVVAPDGEVVATRGAADSLVYPRSAWKPFQTVAALRAGARLDAEQLTVVTSSHVGAPVHVAAVASVLAAAGLDESALRTPEAWPASGTAARARAAQGLGTARICMNCSGNHAGMLAGAAASGWSTEDYLDPRHRIHLLAEQAIREFAGEAPAMPGTDGCGGPVWAVPLVAVARGYARLFAAHPALAAAIRAHPVLIEGAGTPTSRAVEHLGVVAKAGAEGVSCMVAPDGTAVAVKLLDGSGRAAAAVAVELLLQRGAVDADAATAYLQDPSLTILGGAARVGRIRVLP